MTLHNNLLPVDFDRDDFLRHYWQKKPMLIRGNRKHFADPIEPDELAGLACEEFIESRLILNSPDTKTWTLRNGPFSENDFSELPETHWTLLVQAVDQWHEGVKSLLKDFDFIPSWRIEDIMISFASDAGSVGPHFDYYDVFLIQGLGKKRWRLGGHADSASSLLPNTDLRLLENFTTTQDWIVEPGDILYLPPNVAHYGEAIGDSITYSVGFRTPSIAEIIDDFGSEVILDLREDQRYTDTEPRQPKHKGEISASSSEQLIDILKTQLLDKAKVTRWLGLYMTSPKYPELFDDEAAPIDITDLRADVNDGLQLTTNPASRFAFSQQDGRNDLFVDGHLIVCTDELATLLPALCNGSITDWREVFSMNEESANLVVQLYNQGSLIADEADAEADG